LLVEEDVFVSPTLAIYEKRSGEKDATADDVRAFANMLEFIRRCHAAGVKIVVGSHTSAPFAGKGRAYQRELELLIDCGLTPMEAITAGTLQNARFFDIENRLGTVEPGKLADLIVVEGNPAVDIADLQRLRRVMLNGRWIENLPAAD
jgi:imidazolonepropionase-like amidohydrolase